MSKGKLHLTELEDANGLTLEATPPPLCSNYISTLFYFSLESWNVRFEMAALISSAALVSSQLLSVSLTPLALVRLYQSTCGEFNLAVGPPELRHTPQLCRLCRTDGSKK